MGDPEIFISYAWKGESETLVNKICDAFATKGYQVLRDKSTMTYKDSIKDFMERIGRGKYIIAVVSDKYMKSEYCMYEAYRMFQSPAFRERVFPIVLPDADVFSFRGQAAYLRYWDQEYKALEFEYRSIANVSPTMVAPLTERLRDIEATTRFINDFMAAVSDMNVLTSQMHVESNFDQLFLAIEGRIQRADVKHEEIDIGAGLEKLEAELPIRAPVLQDRFHEHARRLRPFIRTHANSLSEHARKERLEALTAINNLCLEVVDITFDALCAGVEPPAYDDHSPFRGLQSFRPEDRDFFFGREELTKQLVERVNLHPFLAVLGASGSGKSSLVMAGLIPALELGYAIIRPGSDPLSALNSIHGETLVVVDQFEELFTLTRDEETRKTFCNRLLALTAKSKVVLTLRSDFMDEVAELRELNDEVQNHLVNVPSMDIEELRQAMEGQARVAGLRFEEDLSRLILEEVESEPGAMPLLQHALWELWNRRHGRWLKMAEYRAFGGVNQAITSTAEKVYGAYPPAEQEQMRNIFLRLTLLDETDVRRDTRRRVAMNDLIPAKRDPTATSLLLDKLADARLIVKTVDGDKATIEVAHEAIIRNWARLREWVNSKREFFIWRQTRLTPGLEKWQAAKEHFLDYEAALEAKRWQVDQRNELSAVETEFIFHSLLRAPIDMASWLPAFGPPDEILTLLDSYWNDPSEEKRQLGVRALAVLPKSDKEEEIIRRLQSFIFDDPSLNVATFAAHSLCRREEIERLVAILNQEQLPREKRDRLIHVLASTRNLPEIGRQVSERLKKYKRQVLWKAINLLVLDYRNDLSLIFVITFLFGLFGNILVSIFLQVIGDVILPWTGIRADDPLNLFGSSIGSTNIMIVLIVGILTVIQVRLVDRLPLSKGHFRLAVTAALFVSFLFIIISWAGLLSDFQGLETPDLNVMNYSISTNVTSGVRELLVTLILSVFIVRTIFHHPLFFDRARIVERSIFASMKCSGLIQIVYLSMSFVPLALLMVINRVSLEGLASIPSNYQSYTSYFLNTSVEVFLVIAGDTLRLFVYLLGFYFGLHAAFLDPEVRKQLSEPA